MNAVVVCIDGFDHGTPGYANPAMIAPGVVVRRLEPALTYNYGGDHSKHVDYRATKPASEAKENRRRLKAFDATGIEAYQYLLLADAPVTPLNAEHGKNYALRRHRAEKRYLAWEQSGRVGPALQVLTAFKIEDTRALATRAMPPTMRRRYRLDVTIPGEAPVTYQGTPHARYLYLQPGEPMPSHLGHALPGQLPELISSGPGFPRFAIGCTCRDFALGGMDRAGKPGPAFYGCKHMLFYNLCRERDDPDAITFPDDFISGAL